MYKCFSRDCSIIWAFVEGFIPYSYYNLLKQWFESLNKRGFFKFWGTGRVAFFIVGGMKPPVIWLASDLYPKSPYYDKKLSLTEHPLFHLGNN